ncbi:MAG TPA: alpha/beta hydrolase [Thermoanaerobaculia bacterium]|nr:alpha/beta hydrolase [Thermoanaerobaculia bacterium]
MSDDILARRIVYQIPGMEKVEVRRGFDYLQGSREAGESGAGVGLDVYLPPDLPPGLRVPGVVLIHGGPAPSDAGSGGGAIRPPRTWGVFQSYGELIAASGMVAVTFDHRYIGWGGLDQAAADIDAAITYTREHAESYQLDPNRLGLWAFSGGGVLLTPYLRQRLPYVRALAAYYPILDLADFRDVGPELTDELVARYSPAAALGDRGVVPFFLGRAGQDSPKLTRGVDRFVQAALAANLPLALMNHPGGKHGFDVLDDDLFTRTILARTIDFLKACL